MNTREQFWATVDAELDARRDPLAHAELRAWMRMHEQDALELADVCAGLALVARAPEVQLVSPRVAVQALPRTRPRRALVPLAAAALLAGVALGAWLMLRPRAIATPTLTAAEELMLHPVVPAPELGSVQAWEIVSTVESTAGRETVRSSEGRLCLERRATDESSSAGSVVLSSERLAMR